MDIAIIYKKIEKGEKLKNICNEHNLNFSAYRQKLYRYRKTKEKPKIILPNYIKFINWCRDHPEVPFAKQMFMNCEDNQRKHWRSIVINTFELLTYYLEEG